MRLDSLLSDRGLFPSRNRAAASVLAGDVLLLPGRRRADKPGQLVPEDVEVELVAPPPFVSRGGIKLRQRPRRARNRRARGAEALDVGASTGGFTDCLLQRGTAHVVAVDVAYGELDWKLRSDERVTVIERRNARGLLADELPYAPDLIVIDVSFISVTKVLGAALACAAAAFDCLALVKPQFESGREAVGKGGVVRSADARRGALVSVGQAAHGLGAAVLGYASSGLPGPKGNLETFVWLAEGSRAASMRPASGARRVRGGTVTPIRVATVFTHRRPSETGPAIEALLSVARDAGAVLRFDREETAKHRLEPGPGIELNAAVEPAVDICFALGGDGTILNALRTFAETGVPVFSINFGEMGFLAAVDREDADIGCVRALAGDFEVLSLPAIEVSGGGGEVARDQRRLDPPPAWQRVWPTSSTPSVRMSSAGCAATDWWSRRRPGRPATTSPTAGR